MGKKEKLNEESEESKMNEAIEQEDKEAKEAAVEDPCAQLEKEKEEINQKYFRISADFQNYKKRIENEKKDIYAFANEKIIIDLLDIKDNFERAIFNAEDQSEGKGNLLEGLKMTYMQLTNILEKYCVKEIEALNKDFDPNYHHAVLKALEEGVDSDIVIDVMQKGYTLNSKVIRPSMVKVSE